MLRKRSESKLATTTITNEIVDELKRTQRDVPSGLPRDRIDPAKIYPIKQTTAVSGQTGRYNGKVFFDLGRPDATGALIENDVGELPAADDCILWDSAELTDVVFGRLVCTNQDGKPVFLIIAGGGGNSELTNGTVTGQVWQTVSENVNAHQFPVAHAIT